MDEGEIMGGRNVGKNISKDETKRDSIVSKPRKVVSINIVVPGE